MQLSPHGGDNSHSGGTKRCREVLKFIHMYIYIYTYACVCEISIYTICVCTYIYFHHVHLSIDSMFGCCMCSGILYFVLPSLTCYHCDLQYHVSVSRGKLCMPCSQASAAQSLACLRRCHGRIGWAGQPGGTKTCKLKWYAVSCYMICCFCMQFPLCWNWGSPNISLLDSSQAAKRFTKKMLRTSVDQIVIQWKPTWDYKVIQGESVGCKGRQRKISVLGPWHLFFFRKPILAKAWSKSMYG